MSEMDPFADMDRRMRDLAQELADNTHATKANAQAIGALQGSVSTIEKNTGDIVEFFNAGKGAFRFLSMLATLAKWLGYIAGACTAVYGALQLAKTGIDIRPK